MDVCTITSSIYIALIAITSFQPLSKNLQNTTIILMYSHGNTWSYEIMYGQKFAEEPGKKVVTVEQETLEVENFRKLVKNMIFVEKTFVDCSLLPCHGCIVPKFCGENFLQIATKRRATKLRNSRKFSPWKVSRYTVTFLCY